MGAGRVAVARGLGRRGLTLPTAPLYFSNFSGGLNTLNAPNLLTDSQARDLQNVQGTTAGAIVKRNGTQMLATPPGTLLSLYAADEFGGTLIAADSSHLYSVVNPGTVTTIKSGLSDGHWEWVSSQATGGQGPAYGMNGVDTPQQWSGSGSTADWTATTGTVPNGKYMVLAGNRIWVSGVGSARSRVFFSDLIPANNGPITWPAQNVAVFDENDGFPITGLGHVGPYILVCKQRKLFVITDMNTGDARRLSDNIGCVSHRSIAEAPEGTYFLAPERGVYVTDGSKLTPVSDVIKPDFDAIFAGTLAKAAGVYFNGHYHLSVDRGSGVNDTVYDYDSSLQSWWRHTLGANQFTVWSPLNQALLCIARAASPGVDQCFVPGATTDNGTPFMWRWRGPWQSPMFYRRRLFPTPYFRKRLRQLRVEGLGAVDCSVAVDRDPSSEVLKQANIFSGSAIPVNARMYSFGVHYAFSMVFSGTSTSSDMVLAYELGITDRKDGLAS